MRYDLVVLFEHPEWQKPLWAALERHGVHYAALDLKRAAFDPDAVPEAPPYMEKTQPAWPMEPELRTSTHRHPGCMPRTDTD